MRAGEAAEATYANAAAIDYLERAAPLVARGRARRPAPEARQGRRARRRLAARRGGRARGARHRRVPRRRARARVVRDGARRGRAQAGPLRRRARAARRAAAIFEAVGDDAGVGQVQHLIGTLARPAGRLPEGRRELRGEPADPRAPRRQGRHGGPALQPRHRRRVPRRLRRGARATTSGRSRCGRSSTTGGAIAVSMTNLGTIAVLRARLRGGAAVRSRRRCG